MILLSSTLLWISVFHSTTMAIAKHTESYSWYSTIAELESLTKREQAIIYELKNMLLLGNITTNLLQNQIETIMRFSADSVETFKKGTRDVALILQYTQPLDQQLSHLRRQVFPLNDARIKAICDEISSFPDTGDMTVSGHILLDLQKLYNLSAKDLAQGYIMDTFSGSNLSAVISYGLASLACNKIEKYDHKTCLEWRDLALSQRSDMTDTTSPTNKSDMMRRYSELCTASINQTYIQNRSNPELICFLWDNNHHPLLLLRPVRAELLSVAPAVVMFYDVISDKKIEYVLRNATSMLRKATTGRHEASIQFDFYRVAHNCWFDTEDHEVTQNLDRFVEAVTGLALTYDDNSEPLQISNYGVGGQYKPHFDADPPHNIFRQATFMYYLSDVQLGGATVFLYPEIAVRPVKGAAIFWHNLDWGTGSVDDRTSHGSCPVLLGNKWVANQWIWKN